MRFKVLIVDDHFMILEGLKKHLNAISTLQVVGITSNPKDALKLIDSEKPNILVFDYEMPEMNGLELIREAKSIDSSIKTICYTMHNEPWIINSLIMEGVDSVILKTDEPYQLITAIESICAGHKFFPGNLVSSMVGNNNDKIMKDQFTDRELEVLKLVAAELSTKAIADKLCLSENTIETYRKNLLLKMNAKNVAGLIFKGMQLGLI